MTTMQLWDRREEEKFFKRTLKIATPNKLFYVDENGKYLAYWPKGYKGKKSTLQSRNAFIGSYTEKWIKELIDPIAKEIDAFTVQSMVSDELGLTNKSPADVAICKTEDSVQKVENILLLVEVKMSLTWNWEFHSKNNSLKCLGNYTTHQGNPSLLRSDSMLKAIGKSINVRVSGFLASKIPIIIIGNTPVTKNYYSKVDHLKLSGIIQGFYSVNPNPLDNVSNPNNIKGTQKNGFLRLDDFTELKENILDLLKEEREFFSGMRTKTDLGKAIEIASKETTYEKKAEKLLMLLREDE